MTEINKKEFAEKAVKEFNEKRGFNCKATDVEGEGCYFHLLGNFLGWEITAQGDTDTSGFYAIVATQGSLSLGDNDFEINAENLARYKKAPADLELKKLKLEAEMQKLTIDLDILNKEIILVSCS